MLVEGSLQYQENKNKEAQEYRKINASLKKKIKEKDRKIQYLFSCIGEMGKNSGIKNQSAMKKNIDMKIDQDLKYSVKEHELIHHKMTEVKKKQKQNVHCPNNSNIFKQISCQKIDKDFLKLPTLKKGQGRFKESKMERKVTLEDDTTFQYQQSEKPKLVKVSLDKLRPLLPEEVKKKFEMKIKAQNPEII